MPKQTKVLTKKSKFIEIDLPIIETKTELIGNTLESLKGKTIKFDLTRQLRGKSIELTLKIKIENDLAIAEPKKLTLMPYFIRRMIRKRTSYVEDSFTTPTQESLVRIKPFLITRKKVSRVVRKTLRNLARNWLEDYLAERRDNEIFEDILSNRLQKPLSLKLKKTYPLSLCEIRVLEIIRPLKPEEVPKIDQPKIKKQKKEILDQVAEIEEKQIKKAEKEIKKTQEKAAELEKAKEKSGIMVSTLTSEKDKIKKSGSELGAKPLAKEKPKKKKRKKTATKKK